ncbi:hypothetical protein SIN8267_02408 [Sinobacterium norvegicum]|uniref:Uncharacterized protein n=1 Tax=Sinobacterium norvegicum TaxID=1641715 RepID=A0ABN8EM09_9GAMM|nr:hypothetical protein [Sinobacterium norvegicum]CAH0992289.1 hypothetical protein SIN8267_02408 [Sinobacterium norvegicum]
MNELARVHYLEAMGVSSYAPRFILPAAKASIVCEIPVPIQPQSEPLSATVATDVQLPSPVGDEQAKASSEAHRLVSVAEPLAAVINADAQTTKQAYAAFALMFVVANNGMTVVADIPRGRQGRLWFDNGRQFIAEVLMAIDGGSEVTFSDAFNWPLNRQLQGGEAEVSQALTGIFNRIGVTAKQPIIALGKQARYFVPKLMAEQSATICYGHALPSLFANASHKAQLWKNLQPLRNRHTA